MAAKGSTSAPIKGLTDKRNITLTFVVSLSGNHYRLYMVEILLQVIRVVSNSLLDFQNPKHWSNEQETLKLIDKVIQPYIVKKRAESKVPETQKALVIWDVFKGQMTETVKQKLYRTCGCACKYDSFFSTVGSYS